MLIRYKLLTLREVIDVGEVSRLRTDVYATNTVKLDLEKALESLTKENNASADKIFSSSNREVRADY